MQIPQKLRAEVTAEIAGKEPWHLRSGHMYHMNGESPFDLN